MCKKFPATLLLCVVLLLSGCSGDSGDSSSSPAPSDGDEIPQDNLTYIKEHVEEALVGFDVENVVVLDQDGKVTVSVRVKYGLWSGDFPTFCELSSSAALEAIGEKEVELGELTVLTKAESGAMLNWKSKDGSSGTLVDNRDGENNIYTSVGLDEIEDKLNE